MFSAGDRVRLLKSSGNGKTFAPAGSCGTISHLIHRGTTAFVTFDSPGIRRDYIHPIPVSDLEFESPLEKFTRGLA